MVEVLEALATNQSYDRDALLDKYGDVAAELDDCLRNLDFVQNVAPQLAEKVQPGARVDGVLKSPRVDLGDFRIVREIGRGGMGVVYEAEQLSLGRSVALKVLPFAAMLDRQQLKRFKNEARAAATLDHPNIVAVHSVGEERGVHYYAMQLVEGQSLAELIGHLRATRGDNEDRHADNTVSFANRDDPTPVQTLDRKDQQSSLLSIATADTTRDVAANLSTVPDFDTHEYFREVARLGMQAAHAIDHAHQNGILHRDIKPANLLVDLDGKLWVTDFGLARMESDGGMTMTGDLLGTLAYMSPEQALAKRVVVDHRTDIYSLGVTLYEMLALRPPYEGSDRQELLKKIAFHEPRRLRQINRRTPTDLETIVAKAIEKSPDDRYATARELADDLQRFLSDKAIVASPPNMRQRVAKWSRRNQAFVASAAAVMALLTVTAVVATLLVWREKARTQAALDDVRAQKAFAERSAAESKAIVEFFVKDLLGAVEPERALGEKVTVEEIVTEAERKIDSDLKDQPLLEAAIRHALGEIHLSLGNADQAERHLRRAHQIRQRILGSDPLTLESVSALAEAFVEQSELREAAELQKQTIDLKRKVLGPEHPDTLDELASLASTLVYQRRLDQAQELQEQVLATRRRIHGTDVEFTLTSKHNLAITLLHKNECERARQLLEEVVDAATRIRGAEHPDTLRFKQTLADAYRFLENHFKASEIYAEIAATQRRIYGPIHPRTVHTMEGLVEMLFHAKQYDEAVERFRKTYEQVRTELGLNHRRTLEVAETWAKLLAKQGNLGPARRALQEIHDSCAQTMGPEHPITLRSRWKLANFLERNEEFDQALPLQEQVVDAFRRIYGPESPETLGEMHDLARILSQLGAKEKARRLFEETLRLRRRVLGADDPDTLVSVHYLANTLAELGENEEAELLFREEIETRRRVLGPDHVDTLKAMDRLTNFLFFLGRPHKALEVCRESFAAHRRAMGPEHPMTLDSQYLLGYLLSKCEILVESRQVLEELVEKSSHINGVDAAATLNTKQYLALVLADMEGQLEYARQTIQEVVEKRGQITGPEHPETLKSMIVLSGVLRKQGQQSEAYQLDHKIGYISYRAKKWGRACRAFEGALEVAEGSEQQATTAFWLAMSSWKDGRLQQARTAFANALNVMQQNAPENVALQRLHDEAVRVMAERDAKH